MKLTTTIQNITEVILKLSLRRIPGANSRLDLNFGDTNLLCGSIEFLHGSFVRMLHNSQ